MALIETILWLLAELVGWIFVGFFGAAAGVLWPPKSAAWARKQRIAIALAVAALAAFIAAGVLAKLNGWTSLSTWLVATGGSLGIAFLLMGNACRRYHEAAAVERQRPI